MGVMGPDSVSAYGASDATPQHLQRWTWLTMPPVNLNHFRLLRVVGKGAFGKVRIVERKDTGLTFALKYIRKDEGKFACTIWAEIAPYHDPGSTRASC